MTIQTAALALEVVLAGLPASIPVLSGVAVDASAPADVAMAPP